MTVTIGDLWNVPGKTFGGGDIIIIAYFRIPFIPHDLSRPYRFVAERQRNGKFHWLPQPIE